MKDCVSEGPSGVDRREMEWNEVERVVIERKCSFDVKWREWARDVGEMVSLETKKKA